MNGLYPDKCSLTVESLLAAERELVPEPNEVRERVIERARASLASNTLPLTTPARSARWVSVRVAAAAGVVLTTLCAAAFFAGYRARSGTTDAPSPPPSIVVNKISEPSVLVALIPVGSVSSHLTTNSDAVLGAQHPGKQSQNGASKEAIDIEGYAKELRVLQPARQAVASHDFNMALSVIAEHQRLFPSGRLAEEREALRVKALLGLGRAAEAQRAGATFRSRFPKSALLGRIEEMLGNQK
jgi:hypothetical protein